MASVSKPSALRSLRRPSLSYLRPSWDSTSLRRSFTERSGAQLHPGHFLIPASKQVSRSKHVREAFFFFFFFYFDCREHIQSNFIWQVERIPETFLLLPRHTKSKSEGGQRRAELRCSTPKPRLSPAASGHNENCSAESSQWRSDRSTRCSAAQ